MPKSILLFLSIILMGVFNIAFFRVTGTKDTSLHRLLVPFMAVIGYAFYGKVDKKYKMVLTPLAAYITLCVAAWLMDKLM